jgi:anaerobic magnesium-protoporphyrin IX monomethyl ester cyclase
MSKIIFIEPKAPNLHIFSKFMLPRLGLYILGTLAKQRGWDVEIVYEEMQKIDFSRIGSSDLVGISTITSTAPRAYMLADKTREIGIPVIMGGPHVTFQTEEALEHADFVIRGEGEKALMAFFDAWESKTGYETVPNLSYKKNGNIVHNPLVPNTSDLDQLPFPDLVELHYNPKRLAGHRTIPILASRGCPFDCAFCSVTSMFGKQYRFRSTQNIIEELRRYNDKKNIIFFYDDNFAANPKRTKELLQAMIEENFKFKWTTQVRADVAKDLELVRLMKKAGCHTLYIGFESVNPESLKEMKKKQTVEEITRAVKVLRRHKIHIHGMFVYGFDEDDWKTVKKTVRFAKKTKLTSSQFLILTPLPGSEFFNKVVEQGRILLTDWALYDAHHAVFKPSRLSLARLQKAQIFSHKRFYSLFEIVKKFLRGKWIDLGLAHYARNLNRLWQKKNKTFLKVVDLIASKKDAKIVIDYKQNISL